MPDNNTTNRESCPECGALCIAKVCNQKRCSQCGHQWPPIARIQQGPTRRDVLNGTARYIPGRIIFFRF